MVLTRRGCSLKPTSTTEQKGGTEHADTKENPHDDGGGRGDRRRRGGNHERGHRHVVHDYDGDNHAVDKYDDAVDDNAGELPEHGLQVQLRYDHDELDGS